jgi:nitroreductase
MNVTLDRAIAPAYGEPVAPIHDLLAKRASTRAYDGQPVASHELLSLLEAARWAPSSFNQQPWRFVLWNRHSNADAFNRAFATLGTSNQSWVSNVPILIGVFADTVSIDGNINSSAAYDTGAAAFSLVLQAEALGLSARQIGGFNRDALREEFGIPATMEIKALIAVGHLGVIDTLAENLKTKEQAPRIRRAIHEIVFSDGWDQPL